MHILIIDFEVFIDWNHNAYDDKRGKGVTLKLCQALLKWRVPFKKKKKRKRMKSGKKVRDTVVEILKHNIKIEPFLDWFFMQ